MISIKLITVLVVLGLSLNAANATWDEVNAFLISQNPDDLSFHTKLAIKSYLTNLKSTLLPTCCQIKPPDQPMFDATGHFIGTVPTACPNQYLICCKGYVNILGTCMSLNLANELLPHWQQTADSQGISLAQAIQQSGVLIG